MIRSVFRMPSPSWPGRLARRVASLLSPAERLHQGNRRLRREAEDLRAELDRPRAPADEPAQGPEPEPAGYAPLRMLPFWDVPVVINSFNRLRSLRRLVDWLLRAEHARVVVVDNARATRRCCATWPSWRSGARDGGPAGREPRPPRGLAGRAPGAARHRQRVCLHRPRRGPGRVLPAGPRGAARPSWPTTQTWPSRASGCGSTISPMPTATRTWSWHGNDSSGVRRRRPASSTPRSTQRRALPARLRPRVGLARGPHRLASTWRRTKAGTWTTRRLPRRTSSTGPRPPPASPTGRRSRSRPPRLRRGGTAVPAPLPAPRRSTAGADLAGYLPLPTRNRRSLAGASADGIYVEREPGWLLEVPARLTELRRIAKNGGLMVLHTGAVPPEDAARCPSVAETAAGAGWQVERLTLVPGRNPCACTPPELLRLARSKTGGCPRRHAAPTRRAGAAGRRPRRVAHPCGPCRFRHVGPVGRLRSDQLTAARGTAASPSLLAVGRPAHHL